MNSYLNKKVLITGGLGFIGSNFLNMFVPIYPDYNFINMDDEKYCADHENVKNIIRFFFLSMTRGLVRN